MLGIFSFIGWIAGTVWAGHGSGLIGNIVACIVGTIVGGLLGTSSIGGKTSIHLEVLRSLIIIILFI